MKEEIRGSVVGLGAAGAGHCGAIAGTSGFRLVAGCDAEAKTRERAGHRLGVPTYPSLREMLGKEDLDLVVVATPDASHAPLAIEALRAGKHLVVEKPMCLAAKEADEMIEAARQAGTVLTVFQNRRWDADFLALKEVFSQGIVGEVFKIESRLHAIELFRPGVGASFSGGWRTKREHTGGISYDWGSHLIDQVLQLVSSRPSVVYGFCQRRLWGGETDDHFECFIRFDDGVLAEVQASDCVRLELPRWFIIGTKGTVRSEGYWGRLQLLLRAEAEGKERSIDPGYGPSEAPPGFYQMLREAILGKGKVPVAAEEARQVIRIIEAARLSSERGEAVRL